MTKKEQLRFCNELREYIAEQFSASSYIKEKHNRARLRAYRNEVLVRGL